MPDFSAPLGAGSPQSVIDYANQQQQLNDVSNQRGIQTATGVNDLQAKQRAMQISMLSGILNEPDPEKQRSMIGNIVPIANRLNPSYQIDQNVDVPTIRALVQSQISPEKQAELANQRQLFGIKASEIKTDPVTGALIKVNKFTGESSPVSPQEEAIYQAGGNAGDGIFPQPSQPQAAPSASPIEPTKPAFGFPLGSLAGDANSLKLARSNAAKFDANRQGRDIAADAVLQNVAVLKQDLANVKGGSTLDNLGLQAGGIIGTKEARNAQDADANAKELALNLTSLNQSATGSASGRGTVVGLKTLLSSKPDPYSGYQENNLSNLNKIEGEVNKYKLETEFLNAYKEANPLHIIDNNAYKLFDSLTNKYPVLDKKDGKFNYNESNVNAIRDVISDALANPNNYMGRANDQANAQLKSPGQTSTPINTPEAIGQAYQSGKITKEQAKSLLAKHGIQ